MSFQQALSGLNAASRGLDIIGNNIANANTIGAKAARIEFSDVYAGSIATAGTQAQPLGVQVGAITQSFTQGNINLTGNDLDVAINGQGLFQMTRPDGSIAYSRAGEFKLDREGYLVNTGGDKLMGYSTDSTGLRTGANAQAMQMPLSGPFSPRASGTVTATFNLDATTPVATATTPMSQTSTTLTTYDSLGIEVPLTLYWVKTNSNTWDVYSSVNGASATRQGQLSFGSDGALSGITDATGAAVSGTRLPVAMAGSAGSDPSWTCDVDFGGSTQLGAAFSLSRLSQDGWPPGQLTSLNIGNDGTVSARYSNGQTQSAGQIMLTNFRNMQGLMPLGGGLWAETPASGSPVVGAPGQGSLGALQSGAVEESNVDLTAELVNMMTAQRFYQANAQTIKTLDQLMSTMVNMR